MDILYVFLPFILLFGMVTSYEDMSMGKIRNRWISLIMFFSVFLWFLLYFLKIVDLNYIFLVFIQGLLSLIIGFFIWCMGLWGAGDAKLYFAFSFLMPFSMYHQNELNSILF